MLKKLPTDRHRWFCRIAGGSEQNQWGRVTAEPTTGHGGRCEGEKAASKTQNPSMLPVGTPYVWSYCISSAAKETVSSPSALGHQAPSMYIEGLGKQVDGIAIDGK